MAQSTMYPAMAGSPKTALSSLLSAAGTTAYVDNLEKLPAAPNLVTLWITEDTWERCIYSAKSAESGPGTITIARSGTGHASSASNAGLEWPAGTKVARNPSELDHSLFKANIEDLETNKITASGVTYENLAANSDIGTGATQVAQGNHTHTPASLGAASGSTTTKTLYVYGDATGTGDGSTKANGFTTLSACLAAMPDIINHAYVIKMCAAAAPYAATTVQKTVGAGSITIEGEFYKNGTVASAGSTVGKFNTQAGDTGAASGDKVLMIKYSSTVGASTPSDAFVDTVASVDGTEVTLTSRTTDAFDTTWRYVIVRTVCAGISTLNTTGVIITGLYYAITSTPLDYTNSTITTASTIIDASSSSLARVITAKMSLCPSDNVWQYVGVIFGNSAGTSAGIEVRGDCNLIFRNVAIFSTRGASSYPTIYINGLSYANFTYIFALNGATPLFSVNSGLAVIQISNIDGNSSSDKITTAMLATKGGTVIATSITFGSNITTQKNPANWAATTDGSYIS